MKKLLIIVSIIIISFVAAGFMFGGEMEDAYQNDADVKRVYDIHKLAMLVEEYKEKTGAYPLANFSIKHPDKKYPITVQNRRLITIIKADGKIPDHLKRPNFTYDELNKNGGTAYVSLPVNHVFLTYDLLLADLKEVLGDDTKIPFDPQKVSTGAPNFYQYYVTDNGRHYILSAALYHPNEHTKQVIEHYNKYEIGSQTLPNEKIRTWDSISNEEKKTVKDNGDIAIKSFSHTRIESD